MLLSEPDQTPYDLRFSLLGVPVRVHPFFWIAALFLSGGMDGNPRAALIGMLAIFISIVVHEMGHVLAFRWFGRESHIVLHTFGGLAIPYRERYNARSLTPGADVLISLAGPAAGFLFAALIVGVMVARGYILPLDFVVMEIDVGGLKRLSGAWGYFIYFLVWINIVWGLFNLLPIYPLDGGQALSGILRSFLSDNGLRYALMVSLVTASGLATWALISGRGFFMPLWFGYFAYENYRTLQYYYGDRYFS